MKCVTLSVPLIDNVKCAFLIIFHNLLNLNYKNSIDYYAFTNTCNDLDIPMKYTYVSSWKKTTNLKFQKLYSLVFKLFLLVFLQFIHNR